MNPHPRLVFLGSPAFALPSLHILTESERFKPLLVITQPDRPVGRSKRPMPTLVKQSALEAGIPVLQPENINQPDVIRQLQSLAPDLLITVAYGQKLGKAVRQCARQCAINLHPSLLPKLRGAAPVPFAIWQGFLQTGITIFRLNGRMDAGPIYQQRPFFLFPSENATDLLDRMGRLGAKELLSFLERFFAQPWEPVPQDEAQTTYCRKLERQDCLIDWHQPALHIHHQVRALALEPGAFTYFRGHSLKILESELTQKIAATPSGCIANIYKNTGFTVTTGDKLLLIRTVQPAGKQPMSAWAYHLGAKLLAGEEFTNG